MTSLRGPEHADIAALVDAVVSEARRQSTRHLAREAFGSWRPAGASEPDWDLFIAETAIAACARAMLQSRGLSPVHLPRIFDQLDEAGPHGWLEVPDLVDRAKTACEGGADLQSLGWVYQYAVPRDERRRRGHFYTPRPVVTLMLDELGFSGGDVDGKLLDPACGSGAFLLAASERMIDQLHDEFDATALCARVLDAIHGVDVDPLAVVVAQTALAFMLADYLRDANLEMLPACRIEVGDTLASRASPSRSAKPRLDDAASEFRWVVANPPYGKVPSRDLSEAQRIRFARTTNGHPNLYALFIQVGGESLAAGGRMTFIVPRSFVSGLYFRKLRRFLAQDLDVQSFTTFTARNRVFAEVLQDVVIFTAQKHPDRSEQIRLRELDGDLRAVRQCVARRRSVFLGEAFDHVLSIQPNADIHDLLAAAYDGAASLGDLGIQASTGTVVWNRLKDHLRNGPSLQARPLWWANAIRPFSCARPGNRSAEAASVAVTARTSSLRCHGPALLVKRMTAKEEPRRLVACRLPDESACHPDGYFAENHVNLIRLGRDAHLSLDAVLGLLNSTLYDVLFRALNGNTQVSATELRALPVKNHRRLDRVAALARELSASPAARQDLLHDLDREICDAFEIPERLRISFALPSSVDRFEAQRKAELIRDLVQRLRRVAATNRREGQQTAAVHEAFAPVRG